MRFFPLFALVLLLSSLTPPRARAQQLQCEPCDYAFGKVEVGRSKSFSVKLPNTGTKYLRILTKSKQGSEFRFGYFPLPITLRPGRTVQLPIVFKPTAVGRVTGTFTLVSTALNKSLSIAVAGTGSPLLTVFPSNLDFGNVTVGQSATLSAALTASNGNVTISSDQVTSPEFSIHGLSLPVTISSGHSVQVKIRFTPKQSGTAPAKAGYFSNAVVSPGVQQLTGTGVAPSAHSASLTWQEADPSVVGFNIYRGKTHGGPYQQINTALEASTNYTDYTVVAGITYYYVTTAVNGSGKQSAYSNETKAVIPSP
jgi:ASPM-SPD-2-Hydin domain-containing protein